MKNGLQLLLAAVVAALVGALWALVGPTERASEARGADANELAELRRTLDTLAREQQALAERLAALPAAPAAAPTSTRTPARDLDEAIAAYMARQLTAESAMPSDGEAPADVESAAIAERILAGEVSGSDLEALWQKLRDEERIDGVLAEIERQAALAPNNPDLQAELGKAYIEKLFDAGMGPMAAVWGEKADKAFDRALELDEMHWEARFEKALSLSHYPTFLGKQGEAVRQFEILMGQQERTAPAPQQARTYFFLGNLYEQTGEHDKAVSTWKRGAERFPDNQGLRAKMEGR